MKKFLTLSIVLALTLTALTGCGNSNKDLSAENSEQTTTEATPTAEPEKEETTVEELPTANLSESSTPIGVSEFSATYDGYQTQVSGKFTNNDTKYKSVYISAYVEILNADGKVVDKGNINTGGTVRSGETFTYEGKLSYNFSNNMTEDGTYTVNIKRLYIQDGEEYVENENFTYDSDSIFSYLTGEKYNVAQLKWEELKEKYTKNKFKKKIKEMEARMKDMNIDPDNISAGEIDKSAPSPTAPADTTAGDANTNSN